MFLEIVFVGAGRRMAGGALCDIIDYRFRIKDGGSTAVVAVGITGAFHDPAPALGIKPMLYGERIEAASAWLRSRIDKRECNPFARENADTSIDLPAPALEYWIEYGSIPQWL
jgi:hypothetical protein